MSIIAPSNFIGEISISQKSNIYMDSNIQYFIDKYEKKVLKQLLGAIFYDELVNGLAQNPIDPKWTFILNNTDLKEIIANYVYYFYKIDETTQSMGISEVKPNAENAMVVNSNYKQVRAWNEMVDMARSFDLDLVTYPNFVKTNWLNTKDCPDIYYFKNTLGF